ncbi:MAG TPA: NDP-sugar synthase [Candidatus Melainabacteria bacterium]|jgi:mannose-1-phosphate guanylyltransferase|nr:NDP-sugar synthase [Candidatus Melainabacteria bacterium]HIN67005.1 NDP-sugar synthase [Candidatus Obscuribacterales bacterium]
MNNMEGVNAIVLAAGVGSRLDPLTSQVPKPLVPIANVPVMEHIIKLLAKNQIRNIHANLHYKPEQIAEYFGDGSQLGVNLQFKYEPQLSGDAGGVRACRQFLMGGTFVVLMGDLLTDADLTRIVREHKEKKAIASIAVKQMPHEELNRFGVVVTDSRGFIKGFQEKPEAKDALSDKVSTGIYVLEPEVFHHMPAIGEYGFGRQLFPELIEKGLPVLGIDIEGYWSDVGTIQQYRQANFDAVCRRVKLGLPEAKPYRQNGKLTVGERSVIEYGCDIDGALVMGSNSRLGAGTTILGNVAVGDNCVIEPGAILRDCVIWSNSVVQSGAHIEHSVICSGSVVPSCTKHVEANHVSVRTEEQMQAA